MNVEPQQNTESQENRPRCGWMKGPQCKKRMLNKHRIGCWRLIPIIFLGIIGVNYEKAIWNEIDPLSDKWNWNQYSKNSQWEKDIKDVEDEIKDVEDGIDEHWGEHRDGEFEQEFDEERIMEGDELNRHRQGGEEHHGEEHHG